MLSSHFRWFVSCCIVLFVGLQGSAQDLLPKYKTIPISATNPKTKEKVVLDSRQITKQVNALRRVITDLKLNKGSIDAKKINAYYLRYFALMTQEDQLGKVATHRQKILGEIRGMKTKEAHDHLVGRVFFFCNKLIPHRDGMNYHPVLRHNCMLIVAGLNRVEVKTGSNAVPEVAISQAREFMLKELNDPKQIDAVRIAALVGLQRHAELSRYGQARAIPSADKAALTKVATDLLAQHEAPNDRSVAAHVWFQRLAADILGSLGDPGQGADAPVTLLDETVRNQDLDLSLRCAASHALGRMKYTKTVALEADASAAGMGSIAVAACRAELERMERAVEAKQNARGGGAIGGGYGSVPGGEPSSGYGDTDGAVGRSGYPYGPGAGIPGQPPLEPQEDPIITATRRQLKHHLNCVSIGLVGEPNPQKKIGGMLSLAQGQQQNAIRNIVQGVSGIMKSLDEPNLRIETFKRKLKAQADALERASTALLAAR